MEKNKRDKKKKKKKLVLNLVKIILDRLVEVGTHQ